LFVIVGIILALPLFISLQQQQQGTFLSIMRAIIALFAIACVALAVNNDDLLITSISLTRPCVQAVEVPHAVPTYLEGAPRGNYPAKKVKGDDIDIGNLIEIGKQVWEIVKAGKPVVDYKNDWAGCVPEGVDWMDMEGFKDMTFGPFAWTFKNTFGVTNVNFKWHFAYACKGSYNGHGAFLVNVGTAIEEIYAAWGYTVDVTATVDSHPINYGTKVDPIAGLAVEVTMEVKTVLQSFTERCRVSIRGDCSAQILACDQ